MYGSYISREENAKTILAGRSVLDYFYIIKEICKQRVFSLRVNLEKTLAKNV